MLDLIQIIADTSVDGVEFYEFTVSAADSSQAAVKAALGATGLDAVGPLFPYGVPLNAMVANLDASVYVYASLGCERNVVPRFNAIPLTR